MRIIFMGTPEFAVPSLRILIENNYDIAAVVTGPDKKKGRGRIISETAVKKFSLQNNLNILQPENIKDPAFADQIRSLKPDLIIVVAFKILPKEIFTIPGLGSFNLHSSLLPKYRGAAPINWALIKGEVETGVSSFFLKEKVDTGNVILQKKINIEPEDDAGTLHDKLAELGSIAVLETVKQIEKGICTSIEQDNSFASSAPKIFRKDCLINWDQNSLTVHNFIRGLSPYPCAFTFLDNRNIKIYRSILTAMNSLLIPGKIIIENKRLLVSTKDQLLEILELQLEGKKRILSADFINGVDKNKNQMFS